MRVSPFPFRTGTGDDDSTSSDMNLSAPSFMPTERGWFTHSTCNGDFRDSNSRVGFCGTTDGIDEPSGLENHFPRVISGLNPDRTVSREENPVEATRP